MTATPFFFSLRHLDSESGKKQAPAQPANLRGRLARRLLHGLAPRLGKSRRYQPPPALGPFETVRIPRCQGEGFLDATWFPAEGEAKGAVLLVPPWHVWGQSFFFRRGRLQALRNAGYHALTINLGGFGDSGPKTDDFYQNDLEDALAEIKVRAPGLPLHLWGVSAGGYWSHMLLSRRDEFSGAVFEDVPSHLILWSKRTAPKGLPFYWFFQYGLRGTYRFMDLKHHAAKLKVRRVSYIGGEADPGALAQETRELARQAEAECLIIPGAGHLAAMRHAADEVVSLALKTFEQATLEASAT